MYFGLYVKYPLFLSDFSEYELPLDRFSKNTQISNFIQIRPMGDKLFYRDGQKDRQT